ncbi:unnamed protein product, partial [Adineta steineri]
MTERKRLSDTDESPTNNTKKIKLIQSTRPLCRYGAKCYRKHPDHLRDYRHPSNDKKEIENDNDDDDDSLTAEPTTSFSVSSSKKETSAPNSSSSSPVKQTTTSNNTTISLMELTELTGEKLLSELYQMKFPSDLHEFWSFCSNINKKNPR